MASAQFPCDNEGVCMVCKAHPPDEEKLTCVTCATPWHVDCLSSALPSSLAATNQWLCPDCSDPVPVEVLVAPPHKDQQDGLVAAMLAVEADPSLTQKQKAIKRQHIITGKQPAEQEDDDDENAVSASDVFALRLKCAICILLPERPVTTGCGHTFCLKCFEKWIKQGKRTCATCRQTISEKMASQPRINSAMVYAIRMARASKKNGGQGVSRVNHFLHNQDRPDKPFTTARAVRNGRANAASGRIFVTVPNDHFGPIPPENDPTRNLGLLVGETWEGRLECRQWGAHFAPVAGIVGQSDRGAQSVVLSGGYVDDEDHGEWFLYTGSGGKDLSGNKRTNKNHSFDQKFEKSNLSLLVSCLKGYPVRVVRSFKEKRSAYAPEKGVRYDGIYRIEKCWQIAGQQGFKVCRYLFVRCDNEPAPWTSDDRGDKPRLLPTIRELKKATVLHERTESPYWDFDEDDSCWKWKKSPPPSRKKVQNAESIDIGISNGETKKFNRMSIKEQLRRGFSCLICKKVMVLPVTTPCGHNFCKSCLEGAFAGQAFVKERSGGGRSLRAQKNVMRCPTCPIDLSDYLQNLQVDIDLKEAIESLKAKVEADGETMESSEDADRLEEDCAGNDEEKAESVEVQKDEAAENNGEPSKDADGSQEDCAGKIEGTDTVNKNSVEELNGPLEGYEVAETNKVPNPATIGNPKRKKADSGEQLTEKGDDKKPKKRGRPRKAEKAVDVDGLQEDCAGNDEENGESVEVQKDKAAEDNGESTKDADGLQEDCAGKDEDIDTMNKNSVGELNGPPEGSDVAEINKEPNPASKGNAKRKKADSGEQWAENGDGKKPKKRGRPRKAEKAVDDGNGSAPNP